MGFKKNMALRFMESSGLFENLHMAVNAAKRFGEKLRDLSNMTGQVVKGTSEQSATVEFTSKMLGELSESRVNSKTNMVIRVNQP